MALRRSPQQVKISQPVEDIGSPAAAEAHSGRDQGWPKTAIFVGIFLATVLLLGCADYLFVRLVDPYGEYGSARFPIVVMDSRRDKMQIFRRPGIGSGTTGLILGSSRSMMLRPSMFSDALSERAFNFAVDNAHIEDHLAIYRWAVRQGAPVYVLVIGLDVVAMHPDDVPDHMFQRIDELKDFLSDPAEGHTGPFHAAFSTSLDRLKRPFTAEYLKDSVKSVGIAITNIHPSRGFELDGYPNGGMAGVPVPQRTFDLTRPIAAAQVASYIERFKGMHALSAKRRGYMNTLLSESKARGVRTIIWLTPVHPRLMQAIESTTNYPELLQTSREYLQELKQRFGATVYDFSDVQSFGGNATDWQDTTHMGARNMDRVARELAKGMR